MSKQEAHLICPHEQVEAMAHAYVEEFKGNQAVQVLRWGYTSKQRQGFIILEWDGEVPWPFLDRLEQSKDIQDFYLRDVCYDLIPLRTTGTSQHVSETPPVGATS
jgi:hypothetical protein